MNVAANVCTPTCSEGWVSSGHGQRLVGVGVRLDCHRVVAVAPERVPRALPGAVAREGDGLAGAGQPVFTGMDVIHLLAAALMVRRVPIEGARALVGGVRALERR